MKDPLSLIVTDASPLITLAAANALDLLTALAVPIIIPDMVYHEVTRHIPKLGAATIVHWARSNRPLVRIEPTEVFAEYQALLTIDPTTQSRNRGEQSATEILTDAIAENPELNAILLYEDSDISKRRFAELLPERVMPLTTQGYLDALECAGRIQSADHIIDLAISRGRNVKKQCNSLQPDIATAIKKQLAKNNDKGRG